MSLPATLGDEFARDYNFYFSLFYNPLMSIEGIVNLYNNRSLTVLTRRVGYIRQVTQMLKNLFDTPTLIYISSLAKKVTPPKQVLDCTSVSVGGIKIPIPASYQISNFTVEYLDDKLCSVKNFHTGWMNSIKNGWNFELLSFVSLSATFGDVTRNPDIADGEPVPVTIENYPQVFPVSITRSDYDKSGEGLQTLTVEYVRVPRITESELIKSITNGLKIAKQYVAF